MKYIKLMSVFLLSCIPCGAQDYLGTMSNNRFQGDGTSNPFSLYNNRFYANSPSNPYGPYGNRFSPYSANNPFSTNGPRIYGQVPHHDPEPSDGDDGDEYQ